MNEPTLKNIIRKKYNSIKFSFNYIDDQNDTLFKIVWSWKKAFNNARVRKVEV